MVIMLNMLHAVKGNRVRRECRPHALQVSGDNGRHYEDRKLEGLLRSSFLDLALLTTSGSVPRPDGFCSSTKITHPAVANNLQWFSGPRES
jgi:hypothetical protein